MDFLEYMNYVVSFINLVNKYLLSTYVVGTGNVSMKRTYKSSPTLNLHHGKGRQKMDKITMLEY